MLICILLYSQHTVQGNVNLSVAQLQKTSSNISIQITTAYIEQEPIRILNDSAFELYGFEGEGTLTDPFLIEGYNITTNTVAAIHVENTAKHFIIRNNILDGIDQSDNAIMLLNVTHGTIVNNQVYHARAINIEDSSNNTFIDNWITDCYEEFIVIFTNSNFSTIIGNLLNDSYTAAPIALLRTYNSIVFHNTLNNEVATGIYLDQSEDNTIIGNTITNCSSSGIQLYGSQNNGITENSIFNCSGDGIYLWRSSDNIVSYNNLYNNTDYGINVIHSGQFSDNNTITMNNFLDNNVGYIAQDYRPSQGYTEYHLVANNFTSNYWSDWSGTGNYSLDGIAHNNDSSPLANLVLPTLNVVSPIAQEYEVNDISIEISGSSTLLQYWYYIEGIDSQNQTWTTSVDRTFSDGTYTLHAYGIDILGNIVHEVVIFSIDTTVDTTTIPDTSTEETSATTTTSNNTSFPDLFNLLICFLVVISIRRTRKKT